MSAVPTPVPVRVDVLSDDKSVRIVDTLLIDPSCWPIPLVGGKGFLQSVEANVVHFSYSMASEAEVQGMGRTVRHFTGRVELYSANLQKKIEDQLRPQFLAIATGNLPIPPSTGGGGVEGVPVSIRLVVPGSYAGGGVAVHEDVVWDRAVPLTPIEFARDLAEEWNLPGEAEVGIATTVLEQLHGRLNMDGSPDPTAQRQASSARRRGAWPVDGKESYALVAQVVAHHQAAEG